MPFESQQAFLGDYTWLTAYNNKVYGVWTETVPPPAEAPAHEAVPVARRRDGTAIRVGTADFSGMK